MNERIPENKFYRNMRAASALLAQHNSRVNVYSKPILRLSSNQTYNNQLVQISTDVARIDTQSETWSKWVYTTQEDKVAAQSPRTQEADNVLSTILQNSKNDLKRSTNSQRIHLFNQPV